MIINSIKISIILTIYSIKFVNGLEVVYVWTQLDFLYPNTYHKYLDKISGNFIPGNCIPMDVDVQYLEHAPSPIRLTFVTIPRYKDGVPASLGTVFEQRRNEMKNPLIAPFPRWEWHQEPELCKEDRLVSVIRIQIDQCGRLWVLDSGRIKGKIVCPPQILVFQMANYLLLRKYEIPRGQYEDHSLLVTIVVESLSSEDTCSKNPFAYIADSRANALIVYDYQQNESWRIKHRSFNPIRGTEYVILGGKEFFTIDGISGLAVAPPVHGQTHLYYYPQGSNEQSRVDTEFLKDKNRFITNTNSSMNEFETSPNKINVQRSAAAFSAEGILYFGSITDSSIKYWNRGQQFRPENIITLAQNNYTLQYPSGVKIIKKSKNKEELFVLSNSLHKLITGPCNDSQTNFLVLYTKHEKKSVKKHFKFQ